MGRGLGVVCGVSAALVLVPAVVLAAPRDVERGHALLVEANFEGALAAFEQAEAGGGLDRATLVRLLEGRVLAHHGLGHRAAMERALAELAALDPRHTFGPEVPPEVTVRFAQIVEAAGGGLAVQVRLLHGEEGYELVARPVRAPSGLVRQVRVLARRGDASWREGLGGVTFGDLPDGEVVRYLVEIVGPGGAVLAREEGQRRVGREEAGEAERGASDATEPERAPSARRSPLAPAPSRAEDDDSSGGGGLWIGLGVGAALLAAGAVAAVLLAGDSGASQTLPRRPVVEGF